jgi:RING-H2 zinc finger domain
MSLPETPGLKRRLAYGNLIRNNHFRRRLRPNNHFVHLDYNTLVELEPVVIQLISDTMIRKTCVTINENKSNFCVICQEFIKERDFFDLDSCIIRILSCQHVFHIDCIDRWFSKNYRCPTCKKDIRV